MNEFKTMRELVHSVFGVGEVNAWEPTAVMRFVVKAETGLKHLQQKWICKMSGKWEWRDVPLEQEDAKQNP